MSLPTIWLVGDFREAVFADAVDWLTSKFACVRVDSPDLRRGQGNCADAGEIPCALVFLKSHAGQFSVTQIEKLHALEPLARLIVVTGPWCEGEQRSGRPIPGVVRVPWRNWRERLSQELAITADTQSRPRTITETELLEIRTRSLSETTGQCGQVLICTAKIAVYSYLADAVEQLRGSVSLFSSANPVATAPDVVIFDGWEQASLFEQQDSSKRYRPGHRILLLHFPRPEDHVLADTAGIDAVLAHPLSIADFNTALSNLLQRAA